MAAQRVQIIPTAVFAALITPEKDSEVSETKPLVSQTAQRAREVAGPAPVAPIADVLPTSSQIASAVPQPSSTVAPVSTPEQNTAVQSNVMSPTPAMPASPKTFTANIEYIYMPQPEYPAAAKRMGEEGKVILRVLVDEKGRPEQIDIDTSSGSPRLDDAAKQAVRRALFKPFIDDGKPVSAFAIVPITFALDS